MHLNILEGHLRLNLEGSAFEVNASKWWYDEGWCIINKHKENRAL